VGEGGERFLYEGTTRPMALHEEMQRSGHWLFRHRSYLPLVLVLPTLIALGRFELPGRGRAVPEVWEAVCLAVALVGLAIRVYVVGHVPRGTSGRNTKRQKAAKLNTTGMYSIVRHPLYLGNFLIWLGISMFYCAWWLVAIFVLSFWIYYERIMLVEEEFLREKFGQAFVEWADRTPAFLPRFSQWRSPALPFSLRMVLRKEYPGLMALVGAFFCLELCQDSLAARRLVVEPFWGALVALALITFFLLRVLKKRTSLLEVKGR